MKNIWNQKSRALLLENIEIYSASGMPIHRALQIISTSMNRTKKMSLESMVIAMEQGQTFHKVLDQHCRLSATLLQIISQGEKTGTLTQSIHSARMLVERSLVMRESLISAMIYPCAIGVAALLITIGLLKGVVPQITPLFESMKVTLPLMTRILLALSHIIEEHGLIICISVAAILSVYTLLYKKVVYIRYISQRVLMRIPIVGNIVVLVTWSSLFRVLGGLIQSGQSLPSSYESTVRALTLIPLRRSCMQSIADINHGTQLSQIFSTIEHLPPSATPLVMSGEASGTLGVSLTRIADILDKDIERMLKRVTSLMEPLLMLTMGGVVGFIAISIMMPIYDISRSLQH